MRCFTWIVLASVLGCASGGNRTIPFVQYNGQYGAEVPLPQLMSENWTLDSHSFDGVDTYSLKEGKRHIIHYKFDTDDDGEVDEEEDLPLYDLRWDHKVDSCVIWTRTIPVSTKLSKTDPQVLLLDYNERISGVGIEFGTYDDTTIATAARYGTKVISSEPVVIANRPASALEIDIANLEQHELDDTTQNRRALLVLFHNLVRYELASGTQYPSVFLGAYSCLPSDYPKHIAEFKALLGQLDFGRGRGQYRGRAQPGGGSGTSDSGS